MALFNLDDDDFSATTRGGYFFREVVIIVIAIGLWKLWVLSNHLAAPSGESQVLNVPATLIAFLFAGFAVFRLAILCVYSFVEAIEYVIERRTLIARAPGSLILLFVDFFFSHKAVKEIFEPLVADLRTEYFNALTSKRKWKARWIRLRYCYHFILAAGLAKLFSLVKIVKSAAK